MSKGCGKIQRAIGALIRAEPDGAWAYEHLAERIYGTALFTRAQKNAIGRALARMRLPGTWAVMRAVCQNDRRFWLFDPCNLEAGARSLAALGPIALAARRRHFGLVRRGEAPGQARRPEWLTAGRLRLRRSLRTDVYAVALIPPRSRPTPPPAGFIQPCQPTLVANPPAGPGWLHEMKHDGYRLIARKDADRVTLWSRYGTDFTDKLPRIAEAVRSLPVDNALIDGEAVVFRPDGHSDFVALRTKAGGELACIRRVRPSQPRAPTISASARSRSGERRSRSWSPESTASGSAKPSRPTARSCSLTPASSAWRGSCRSAS